MPPDVRRETPLKVAKGHTKVLESMIHFVGMTRIKVQVQPLISHLTLCMRERASAWL